MPYAICIATKQKKPIESIEILYLKLRFVYFSFYQKTPPSCPTKQKQINLNLIRIHTHTLTLGKRRFLHEQMTKNTKSYSTAHRLSKISITIHFVSSCFIIIIPNSLTLIFNEKTS
ncbi:hypothetical protein BpHYR1_032695 [Brachionus plicatilis]|uniref:Uncharacterized protein n=1 Tax=Brachionus plicatilis TaxID=10195 RepID=A0A3M7Q3V6_BRAPC|nr:hypothetical protein BpHYR1_032695 [Brachionus plicatilis]